MKTLFTLSTFLFLTLFCARPVWAQTPHELTSVIENFEITWQIDSKEDLIWLTDTLNLDADNDGTADFDSLRFKWDAKYELSSDIVFDADSSAVDWNNDGIIDIENSLDSLGLPVIGGSANAEFTGSFDGKYHTIYNVYKAGYYRNAMFANLAGTQIENLRLMNFRVYTSEDNNAGIAGQGRGETPPLDPNIIRRCWVEGKIIFKPNTKTNVYTGGIVGRFENGEISECYSNIVAIADIDKNRRVSGIVGQLRGEATIKDSYSVSTLTGGDQVGIIGGRIDVDTEEAVKNCYSVGKVYGKEPINAVGNFGGAYGNVPAVSCYWDIDVANDSLAVGEGDSALITDIVGLTTEEFGNEENFVGWDFENVWKMGNVDGVNRPYLAWQDNYDLETGLLKREVLLDLVTIYPNPVNDILNVAYSGPKANYQIINLIGQVIQSGVVFDGEQTVNIGSLQPGLYLLKVDKSKVLKIIKN